MLELHMENLLDSVDAYCTVRHISDSENEKCRIEIITNYTLLRLPVQP